MTKKITGIDGDLHLSIAIKQGDKEAFGRLYDKYAPVLMGLINRILPADSDGEEILQTAFIFRLRINKIPIKNSRPIKKRAINGASFQVETPKSTKVNSKGSMG